MNYLLVTFVASFLHKMGSNHELFSLCSSQAYLTGIVSSFRISRTQHPWSYTLLTSVQCFAPWETHNWNFHFLKDQGHLTVFLPTKHTLLYRLALFFSYILKCIPILLQSLVCLLEVCLYSLVNQQYLLSLIVENYSPTKKKLHYRNRLLLPYTNLDDCKIIIHGFIIVFGMHNKVVYFSLYAAKGIWSSSIHA